MIRAIVIAGVLAAVMSLGLCQGASANYMTSTSWHATWTADFDGTGSTLYTPEMPIGRLPAANQYGGPLGAYPAGCPWNTSGGDSTKVQYRTEAAGGVGGNPTKALRVDTNSTASVSRWAYINTGAVPAGSLNRLHMDVKSSATTATSSWNNFCEGMAGTTVDGGNVIPLWQFSNNQARVYVRRNPDQTPVGAGYSWISAPVATGNSTWHSFDTIWDVTTGDCEYYMDNVLKFKLSVDAAANFSTLKAFYLNRPILNFEFFQLSGAAGGGTTYTTVDTGMYFDNIKVMIPEPGSLLALSVFGIGMFGFMKRRRA